MHKRAQTDQWGKWPTLVAVIVLCLTIGTTPALADVNTTGNNFTTLDPNNALVGGTNDVHFTWDGTEMTSVAVSGQVSNATISSVTPFFGLLWTAHDVAIYGPGTYTVYTGCAAGSPGCGSGTPITFTVGASELGAHMLFDWGGNNDIDVVDIWKPNSVFEPSPMWTGEGGTGDPAKVWNWMSKDWDGNGINGYGMVDGPFVNFSANFNVIAYGGGVCGDPPAPMRITLVSPEANARGLDTTVEFRWKKISDNDAVEYTLSYSTSADFESGTSVTIVNRPGTGLFFAGGAGLFIIGITFFFGTNRRSTVPLLGIVILFAGVILISCQNSHTADSRDLPIDEMSFTATGLSTGTTYYWKVAASLADSPCIYESDTHSFTTQ
jgi:hypothetical protein